MVQGSDRSEQARHSNGVEFRRRMTHHPSFAGSHRAARRRSLDGQITSSLVATLGDRLRSQRIAVAPWRSAVLPSGGATWRAAVSISRFDGIPGESVILEARWELIAQSDGKQQSLGVRKTMVTERIDRDGYDALVAAMQRALLRLGQQMGDSVAAAAQMAKANIDDPEINGWTWPHGR